MCPGVPEHVLQASVGSYSGSFLSDYCKFENEMGQIVTIFDKDVESKQKVREEPSFAVRGASPLHCPLLL
jgi:hypothetical protein